MKAPERSGVFLEQVPFSTHCLTTGLSEACVGLVHQVSQIPASSDTKGVGTQKTFPCQCHLHWRVTFQF